MFEFLRSPKTGGLITASLLFLLRPNLSISSRQYCTVSLRNATSLGCRPELADAPVHVKAFTGGATPMLHLHSSMTECCAL
jgi:hypothetical protein